MYKTFRHQNDNNAKLAMLERLNSIYDLWHSKTGKTLTDDDLARCLKFSKSDCADVGVDFYRIFDETLGKVEEQVRQRPHLVVDLAGYT